jgi:hypothetical protein
VLPARTLAGDRTAELVVPVDGKASDRATPATAAVKPGSSGETAGQTADLAAATTPDEVVPQRTSSRVAPVTKTKPTRRLQPGDLVCGQCGEGNPPTRKFCSRCGEPLATAEVVRRRWYAPLLFWRRPPKTLDAGARPGQKGTRPPLRSRMVGGYRRTRTIVGSALMVVAIVYLFVPPLRGAVNDVVGPPVGAVRDFAQRTWDGLTDDQELRPPYEKASPMALKDHGAALAFDENKGDNSFWAARWNRDQQPYLFVRYKRAVDLSTILVTAGATENVADKYLVPRQLRLRYASGRSELLDLDATGDPQERTLEKATNIRRIWITVTKVHAEQGVRSVAITEIELFSKK